MENEKRMQIHAFHLMPYPYLPSDFDNREKFPSSWVTFSNSHYDPKLGHDLYNRYLDELEYCEELGFDGVSVNEHHQNTYGTMPAPNLMVAALARRTKRLKLLILGNGLPLRDHPLRIAEELAMLGVMSRGRIISGFVRGIGCEYYSMGVNPTHSRERFFEAYDLIIRAWTEPGPFDYEGRHYRVRYVNVWPRPLQKPHPPIWIPGFGSKEIVDWCAHPSRKYPYLATFMPQEMVRMFFDWYREAARGYGYEAAPSQLGHLLPVYVAETDSEAMRDGAQHVRWLYHRGLRHSFQMLFPPGYSTIPTMTRLAAAAKNLDYASMDFETMNARGFCMVGSPDTVRRRLIESIRALGNGLFLPLIQIGDMPHDRTVRSMELFAREVMPAIRAEFASADAPAAAATA